MKSAHNVQSNRLSAGRLTHMLVKLSVCLLFLTASCAQQNQVRYLGISNEVQDTEWGFRGSQARMEVTNNVAVSASSLIEEKTGMLKTEVTFTNASQHYMRLLYRGCPVQIQIHADEERNSEPLFDSFGASEEECERREVVRTLFALEDLEYTELTHLDTDFANGYPGGTYYVTAIVRPNGIPIEVPAGVIELGADGGES